MKIVYTSDNRIEGNPTKLAQEVDRILRAARRNNSKAGITGALIFNTKNFAQVLEGPQALVEDAFAKIQCDFRHGNVVLLTYEPIKKRSFASWAMAYVGAVGDAASAICTKLLR